MYTILVFSNKLIEVRKKRRRHIKKRDSSEFIILTLRTKCKINFKHFALKRGYFQGIPVLIFFNIATPTGTTKQKMVDISCVLADCL